MGRMVSPTVLLIPFQIKPIQRKIVGRHLMSQDDRDKTRQGPRAIFATTHWSVVVEAGQEESPHAAEALAELCRSYWYPLYAYVRRQGHPAHEAQDLTQEFFARLLKKNHFRTLDRERGKFRSWLLASLEHFLAKEWRDSRRLKRGGGETPISLDDQEAEERYRLEPSSGHTPQHLYERRWALTLLETVLGKLGEEYREAGKEDLFSHLQPLLSGDKAGRSYVDIGTSLQMSEGAVKVAVHRLRRRYGELLRAQIANTVDGPEAVDDELRYLMTVLSR